MLALKIDNLSVSLFAKTFCGLIYISMIEQFREHFIIALAFSFKVPLEFEFVDIVHCALKKKKKKKTATR